MTVSKRVANAKSGKFHKGVHKRGLVDEAKQKKASKLPVGPLMLGFFIFVVIGSAVLQIIRTATNPRELPA
ncbi:hypothetical protein HXX76_004431 [Chlamydomonas incerta]|uniref:Stress-associated endoplasmic reticulum protein n=1 Tax=Chlamydomonas incerta TaxID=51695 RepID=A0A835TA72_CHLIN|nr:hypothetical protein HXX76_004431 [Chlamydomonas incerta]|eukprot:KAG2440326.1 hypothetical protein HXX76_004431 [Chlamydomonas incerta]